MVSHVLSHVVWWKKYNTGSELLLFDSLTFFHINYLIVFHWILTDNKSPQITRTLVCILADLNNAVVFTVSTLPFFFKFTSPCTYPLVTVPWTPITIGTIVNFMFHYFFSIQYQGPGHYSFYRILSILICGQPGPKSPQFRKFSLFFIIIWSGHLAEIRWSVSISNPLRSSFVSFSRTDAGLCIYHLFV